MMTQVQLPDKEWLILIDDDDCIVYIKSLPLKLVSIANRIILYDIRKERYMTILSRTNYIDTDWIKDINGFLTPYLEYII
jgi:hypothetical protein